MLRTLFGPLDRASSSSTQSGKILSENRDRARSEDEKERSSVIVVVLFLSREADADASARLQRITIIREQRMDHGWMRGTHDARQTTEKQGEAVSLWPIH